jgi:hypothetical protein
MLDLPKDLLLMILQYVPDKAILNVCKDFYEAKCHTTEEFTISVTVIGNNCCLASMPRLKHLTVCAPGSQNHAALVKFVPKFALPNLTWLTLSGFDFNGGLSDLLNSIAHLNLTQIECHACDDVSVWEIKYMLQENRNLQCCSVSVNLSTAVDMLEFAALANELVGKVNLCWSSLERVPSKLLQYPRGQYRARYLSGQL